MNYGFLVRHGETELNREGIPRALSNVPLSRKGVAQAYAAANLLKGKGVTSIRASNLERTKHTSRIIGKVLGLTPVFTKKLDTLDIGPVLSKMKETEADRKILTYILKFPEKRLPGGQSYSDWLKQIWPELNYFFVLVSQGFHPVLVTHGRVSQVLDALVTGNCKVLAKPVYEKDYLQKPGEVFSVIQDGEKLYFQKVSPMR